jgi:DNA-binding PadR family transcriptional regulator
MNKKLLDCWVHPIKSKIYFELLTEKESTAKAIGNKHPHIPQATLYRHLKGMVDDDILIVAKERKVRNLTEKVYELAPGIKDELAQFIEENPKENISFVIQETMICLLGEFSAYFQKENIDPLDDGIGLFVMPFYATTEELKECGAKLQEVMKPYLEAKATPQRKLRNFARIFTPPRD